MAYGIELKTALGGEVLSANSAYARFIGRFSANSNNSTTYISGINASNSFAMWVDQIPRPHYAYISINTGSITANSGTSGVTRYYVVYLIE